VGLGQYPWALSLFASPSSGMSSPSICDALETLSLIGGLFDPARSFYKRQGKKFGFCDGGCKADTISRPVNLYRTAISKCISLLLDFDQIRQIIAAGWQAAYADHFTDSAIVLLCPMREPSLDRLLTMRRKAYQLPGRCGSPFRRGNGSRSIGIGYDQIRCE
jgi:hypothetical protein